MDSRAEQSVDKVAHTLGELMRFWGFRDVHGRIWGLLYLSPQPVTPDYISKRLKISRGNVSLALQEMQRWGAIQRLKIPGQLAKGYVAETDLWRLITRVFKERERYEAEKAAEEFAAALGVLKSLPPSEKKTRDFVAPRIERLQRLSDHGSALLDKLTDAKTFPKAQALGLLFKIKKELTRQV